MTNQASVSSGSVSDEESEDGYKVGGYHPMKISDEYNGKYTVVKKLGWGHFSTVWLVRNKRNEYSAMKVIKSAKHYTETAEDEIKFLRKIQAEGGHNRLLKIVDSFRIYGPNGAHVSIVAEVCGKNLLHVVKEFHYRGIPLRIVKRIVKQILEGLDFLHRKCRIIHTDIKPENILLSIGDMQEYLRLAGILAEDERRTSSSKNDNDDTSKSPVSPERGITRLERAVSHISLDNENLDSFSTEDDPPTVARFTEKHPHLLEKYAKIEVKLADLGNACFTNHHYTSDIQTRQYRSPEVIIGSPYCTSADIWSLGCLMFELLTGEYLFDPRAGGSKINSKIIQFDKDDDHLAQIAELLGPFDIEFALGGKYSREFFTRNGDLRRVKKLKYWGLMDVLVDKYEYTMKTGSNLAHFLECMLRTRPDKRLNASELLKHDFLQDV